MKLKLFAFASSLLLVLIVSEFIVYHVGLLASGFYLALTNRDKPAFIAQVWKGTRLVLFMAVTKAIAHWTSGRFMIYAREYGTMLLHGGYFKAGNLFKLDESIDNPDQRITSDLNSFLQDARLLMEALLIDPLLIFYYSYKTYKVSNSAYAPLCVYLYFIVSVVACKLASLKLVALNMEKEKREGEFRKKHLNLRVYKEEISIWKGESWELRRVNLLLYQLLDVARNIVKREAFLKVMTETFNYGGALISYGIISVSVFNGTFDDLSPGELTAKISAFSFMIMYLIFRFTMITDHWETWVRLRGSWKRVKELHVACKQDQEKRVPGNDFDVKDLSFKIPKSDRGVVCFTLKIPFQDPPTIYTIHGANGVGKSSLLRCLAGLWPCSGDIDLSGSVVLSPQQPYIADGSNALQQVAYPCETDSINFRLANELCELVEINPLSIDYSKGQQQLLAFCRVLLKRPRFAVLDEPGSWLAPGLLEKLLNYAVENGTTCIVFGHGNNTKGKLVNVDWL